MVFGGFWAKTGATPSLLGYAQGQFPVRFLQDFLPFSLGVNLGKRRLVCGGTPYASCAVPVDPGVHRARGRATAGGDKVGEMEVAFQRNAFLVDELVVNFILDLGVFGFDRDTENDDHVFGKIRFDRDVLEGDRACGGDRDRAALWLGRVLGGLGDRWRCSSRRGM